MHLCIEFMILLLPSTSTTIYTGAYYRNNECIESLVASVELIGGTH